MRDDYGKLRAAGLEVVVITRHDAAKMREHWKKNRLPYLGIADADGKITKRFRQQWKLFKLGRMPAQFLVGCKGRMTFVHYGKSMSDIPTNQRMIELAGKLPRCGGASAPPPKVAPKKAPPGKKRAR